ncbi:MAG: T9SS type A sorting domain-containing protein, partial [Bacteroidetes bacterium]
AGWTARKSTGVDFVALKYHPDGELIWSAFYAAPGKGEDKALAIAVDTSHNVYLTGSSSTSGSGLNIVTVKFDSNGTQLWANSYNGTASGEDKPVAIAVNDSQNVYVAGVSTGTGSGNDYVTLKYDSLGNEQWVKRYNGPANGDDTPYGMALSGTTALYVTGASADTLLDYCTIKYDAATGDSLWAVRYNGTGSGNDVARAIVLRGTSDVFVTGSSQDSVNGYDYVTISYSSAGAEQWVARYNGNANGDDHAYALALHSNSRVYVTGKSLQVGSFYDATTVKYTLSNGSEDWVSSYNGPSNDEDFGVALVGGGSPYTLCTSKGYGVEFDFALVSYGGNTGTENWNTRYNGIGNRDDVPVAVISSGSAVYVTGKSYVDKKTTDIVTIKYVDPGNLKFRTVLQDSLPGKGMNLKKYAPNIANLRDTAFARAFPKIKSGYPGAPGGMVLGNPRTDSATAYGWIRLTKGAAIAKFTPHKQPNIHAAAGEPRGFDTYDGKPFVGEKKDPKIDKYNNEIVGQLIALRLNIGSSDAEVTPPMFGDLTYELDDTVANVPLMGLTLRQIASLTDNFLTYWQKYPTIDWYKLDTVLTQINSAFLGPLKTVTREPLVATGAIHIDSVPMFGAPAFAATTEPLKFLPGSLDETPNDFALLQNYPNPFNPLTNVRFNIGDASVVTLKVYDMLGREIATLVEQQQLDEGEYDIPFDGSSLSSGVYFYRITATPIDGEAGFSEVRRMVLLK